MNQSSSDTVRKGLLEDGATRKYILYAVGEIALVVIGILIALQINNWNEDRKERETEVKILNEVAENLQINIQRLKANIDRGVIDNEISDIIISFIELELPYTDSLDNHFSLALNAIDEGSFLSFVGYESLKNTGFEIIRNNQLKKEIINLFEGTYKDLRARYDRIEWYSDELRKFDSQHFYRYTLNNRKIAPFDFDELVDNKRLLSWLIKLKGYRLWISNILQESHTETERVLQLIEVELGESE